MTRNTLLALALLPTLALACANNEGKQTDAPDELELPPEKKVADETNEDPAAEPDEKKVATKVEPAKPAVVHPQDRDPNQEKAKMKRSRETSAKAKQQLRAGQNDQAITTARAALREHEQNVEAMLVIAEAFYKQGKHELVQSVAGSILKVDAKILVPEEKSQAYNLMGFAYLQAGSRHKAFEAFKHAAETDEKNASAWNNLGVHYMWQGDTKTAESCFEYAVSLDAKFPDAQLNLGVALRANGKLAEAEAAFRQAAKLEPDWAEVHFNLGVLYLDAERIANLDEIARLDAAIAEFEKYKTLVGKGNSSLEREGSKKKKKTRGASDAMGNELVSVAQADLYIKAASKGIESEERRQEREQKRKQKEAAAEDEPPEAAAEGGDDGPAEAPVEPAQPQQPQEPGEKPADKPAQPQQKPQQPQKPGGEKPADKPAQPQQPQKPQQPGANKPQSPTKPQQPQKPKTQKPGG